MAVDPQVLEELALANRILFKEGVLDGWGHVSVRHPENSACFLMSRALAPGLVTAADIIELDLDGDPVAGDGPTAVLERFIHGEIYRARPDVNAVVHSHSPSVIPFGASGVPLQPIIHMAGFLYPGVPVFEIRDAIGDGSDLLISNGALGRALAAALGDKPVALMRGHGNVVVAPFLEAAVARAIYTEVNARIQGLTLTFGRPVTYISPAEGKAIDELMKGRGGTTHSWGRSYAIWKRRATKG